MPVTKTAKRALRSSKIKRVVNNAIRAKLAIAIRLAEKTPNKTNIKRATSEADKAAKKNVLHNNKAAKIKSRLSKLASGNRKNQKNQKTRKVG